MRKVDDREKPGENLCLGGATSDNAAACAKNIDCGHYMV